MPISLCIAYIDSFWSLDLFLNNNAIKVNFDLSGNICDQDKCINDMSQKADVEVSTTLMIMRLIQTKTHPEITGGLTCHEFVYRIVAEVPGPHPIHILGKVEKKNRPIHILPIAKIVPI